ncbi:hypothetical protein [Streptomyces uncialis]|uniref:hypothetical protein n=1 Tax=Streptomyces uncialis TaxID=1048205 RepID=UPI00224CC919|nr:hypothetical protein [Streptomyces uncialis]MCX4663484.1 hypothetical protein [Streptomyces uncialis]
MQSKPIDTARLGVMRCVIEPEARLTQDGEPRRDREGVPQWITGLSVRQLESRRADVIHVVTSGRPSGITEGAAVTVTDLWASEWAVDGRSGTSWRAASLTPDTSGPAASPASAPRGKSSGGE